MLCIRHKRVAPMALVFVHAVASLGTATMRIYSLQAPTRKAGVVMLIRL
jgi:hypothetical protein